MSTVIGHKIFPTAESAKIRKNPNLIHYEGRMPSFGDRFKQQSQPAATTPTSNRQSIGDTVGRYDDWKAQKKQIVEEQQPHHHQAAAEVTKSSRVSADSNVIHSMVSPDYETVMKDFDRNLNDDSVNSSRSSDYEVVHDSYELRTSEVEPVVFETHSEVAAVAAHHVYDSVPRESQYENFPPPPAPIEFDNYSEAVQDRVVRESQANWPPMDEPSEQHAKEEVINWAASKNPYVFSTEDFSIESQSHSHHQIPTEAHHEHVSFDTHPVVIPEVKEEIHHHSHVEVGDDQSDRVSHSSSEKSDGVIQVNPNHALIAELEKSFQKVGTSPTAVKEDQKSEGSHKEDELFNVKIRRRIEDVYRDFTPERFLDEIPTEENGVPIPEWKRAMMAKKLSFERAQEEEQRLLEELHSGKSANWK